MVLAGVDAPPGRPLNASTPLCLVEVHVAEPPDASREPYPESAREAALIGVGRRARELRSSAGLTQEQVAGFLGVSRLTVVRLEQGAHDVGVSRVAALASLFGVEPGSFFDGG